MSVLLIACCYWKRANSWGAAGAIIFGAAMPVAYLIFEQIPATRHLFKQTIGSSLWGILTFVASRPRHGRRLSLETEPEG